MFPEATKKKEKKKIIHTAKPVKLKIGERERETPIS